MPRLMPIHHTNRLQRFTRRLQGRFMRTTQIIAPRRHGSALVLAVAVLVIIAMMGVAYIQVARVDRRTTGQSSQYLRDDIVTQIAWALQGDLLNANQTFLDPDATGNSLTGGGDEPYDFPWTNTATSGWWIVPNPIDPTAAPLTPVGGPGDDSWLASNAPTGIVGSEQWPHLTNLAGYYIEYDNATGTFPGVDAAGYPNIQTVTNGGTADPNYDDTDDTGIDMTDANLVDADGDGFYDSRWIFAPTPEVNGTIYVVAIRIIDNSAMVNANVATALSDTAGMFTVADAPRWWSPGELNLAGFAAWADLTINGTNSGAFDSELQDLLDYRLNTTTSIPTPWGVGAIGERDFHWFNGARNWDSYTTPVVPGVTPARTVGPTSSMEAEFELRYKNSNIDGPNVTTLEAEMSSMLTPHTELTAEDYFNTDPVTLPGMGNPRLWTTVFSGSAPLLTPVAGEDMPGLQMRVDLNNATALEIRDGIESLLGVTSVTLPATVASNAQFAAQFAANIVDYRDTDNLLTQVADTAGPTNFYGFERLPMIVEVYAERDYTGADDGSGNVTWDWTTAGPTPFMIEIYNPYAVEISLENIYLDMADGGRELLTILNGGVLTLDPNRSMVFYVGTGPGLSGTIDAEYDISASVLTWPDADSLEKEIGLYASYGTTIPGTVMGTPYNKFIVRGMPDGELIASTDTTAANTFVWKQSAIGSGTRLDHLTYQMADTDVIHESPIRNTLTNSTTIPTFGTDPKISTVAATAVVGQLHHRDTSIRSNGEIMMIPVFGPTDTHTLGERWGMIIGASDPDEFLIDRMDTTTLGAGNLAKVPWWGLLAERFTTFEPSVNPLVYGTINLNTVPLDLLDYILPIPDTGVLTTLKNSINTLRGTSGMAFVHELWDAPGFGSDIVDNAFLDTDKPIDFDITDPAAPGMVDGIVDDQEEWSMVTRWLSQVASTRSDTYTAFILIHGYQNNMTTLVEQKRMIVIYDRSTITDGSELQVEFYEDEVPIP